MFHRIFKSTLSRGSRLSWISMIIVIGKWVPPNILMTSPILEFTSLSRLRMSEIFGIRKTRKKRKVEKHGEVREYRHPWTHATKRHISVASLWVHIAPESEKGSWGPRAPPPLVEKQQKYAYDEFSMRRYYNCID